MTFLLDLWCAKGRELGAGFILLDAPILYIRHKLELTKGTLFESIPSQNL